MVELGTDLDTELAQGATKTIGNLTLVGRYTQGRRPNVEDRFGYRAITTKGGLKLVVAIVADGIGGSNCGEVAAQMTVDHVFKFIADSEASQQGNTPRLLRLALEFANDAVYKISKSDKDKSGMGTTAAVLAICEGKLYIANVGDSRIYLFKEGKGVRQITVDHSWANEMIRAGSLTEENALKHPKAEELVRSIGYEPQLKVDLGLYKTGRDETAARENQGLPLAKGDRLVICSDGLIKERHDDKILPYTSNKELTDALATWPAEKAADHLIKTVSKRQVDDNATVLIVETQGASYAPAIKQLWLGNKEMMVAAVAGLFLSLCLLIAVISAYSNSSEPPDATQVVAVGDAEGSTPLATRAETTTEPTSENAPRTAADYYGEGVVTKGVNADVDYLDAKSMRLKQGKLVIQTGETPIIVSSASQYSAVIEPDSLAGIHLDDSSGEFLLHCFRGSCTLAGSVGGNQKLIDGQKGRVDGSGKVVKEIKDAQNELFGFAPNVPTPTPVPTPTETPTATPVTPTSTPVTPWPTATPVVPKTPVAQETPDGNKANPNNANDRDGDGVNNDIDICPDEDGGAHHCGCPTKPPKCGGGGDKDDGRG